MINYKITLMKNHVVILSVHEDESLEAKIKKEFSDQYKDKPHFLDVERI